MISYLLQVYICNLADVLVSNTVYYICWVGTHNASSILGSLLYTCSLVWYPCAS